LFRVPAGTADSIIRRMQALYPAWVESYLAALVGRGSVSATGSAGGGDEGWEIYFPEPADLEHARQLLDRRKLSASGALSGGRDLLGGRPPNQR
jgi:hypothetical protein